MKIKSTIWIYTAIVLILFTGPLLRSIDNVILFYLFKYGIILSVLALGIYFYLNKQTLNYLKLSLFIPFTIDYQLHAAFIFITILLFNKRLFVKFNSPLKPIYLLFGFGLLSYIINQFIELNLLSFPLFIFTYFISFVFFGLFINEAASFKDELLRFFNDLILIMSSIIILQIIIYPNIHPDHWNGGTPNAHIAAAYISIALMLNIIKLERLDKPNFKEHFREIIISVIGFPLLFLVDAKYFFILTLLILLIYFILAPLISRKLKAFSFGILVLIIFVFTTSDGPLPISVLTIHSNKYNMQKVNTAFINSPKHQLAKAAIALPFEEPLTFLIGGGPGTFISRAAFLQFNLGKDTTFVFNESREKLALSTKLAVKNSWVKKKYAATAFYENFDPGSYLNRRSGLYSVYFEMGIIGLALFFLFYFGIFKSALKNISKQPDISNRILLCLIPLLFLINYFSHWGEYHNYCIIQYGILGVLLTTSARK